MQKKFGSFGLYVKQCETTEEALAFAIKVTRTLFSARVDHIRSNMERCPSVVFNDKDQMTDRFWLYKLFKMRFAFFKDDHLFALMGSGYPKQVSDLFDGYVLFNSYEKHEYTMDEFPDTVERIAQMKKHVLCEHGDDPNNGKYMRDYMYDELRVHDLICEKDKKEYMRFSLEAIEGPATEAEAAQILQMLRGGY